MDGSVALIVAAHTSLCANHIYKIGSDEQRQRYLPKLATGEWLGCWSLTEPEAGSDAARHAHHRRARRRRWVLNGSKTFTTNAHYAELCVAHGGHRRAARRTASRRSSSKRARPGSGRARRKTSSGMRASATGECDLRELPRPPTAQLLGKEGEAFVDSLQMLDGGRISIAALSVGMAQGAYDAALKYSKQRKQFGRPISEFQAIQHKLADMATDIDAARLLTYRAAWSYERGERVTNESVDGQALRVRGGACASPTKPCRFTAATASSRTTRVEKFYRDVKLCTIGEGTSEIQRLVIARGLVKG